MSVLTSRSRPADPPDPPAEVPSLESGDRLSRAEFERRYDAMPQLKKAEFIEGEVIVGSPVRYRRHSKPHFQLIGWLAAYSAGTPGLGGATTAASAWTSTASPSPTSS